MKHVLILYVIIVCLTYIAIDLFLEFGRHGWLESAPVIIKSEYIRVGFTIKCCHRTSTETTHSDVLVRQERFEPIFNFVSNQKLTILREHGWNTCNFMCVLRWDALDVHIVITHELRELWLSLDVVNEVNAMTALWAVYQQGHFKYTGKNLCLNERSR